MENYVVEIRLRVEVTAPNPGIAATAVAETLRTALTMKLPSSTRGMTMEAAAYELPAPELTNKHT